MYKIYINNKIYKKDVKILSKIFEIIWNLWNFA